MEIHTYSVAELGEHIAAVLDQSFYDGVWVQGEISNLNRSRNGHVYFDLIEPTDGPGATSTARIGVSLFRTNRDIVNRILKRAGGVRMTDGVQVRISAMVSFFSGNGRLTLRMTGIDPSFTLGVLAAERDQLLRTLADEGLLTRNGRIPLPLVPLRVGLVTSEASAAFADFTRELAGSRHGWQVQVVDTQVQGPGADGSIVAAIRTLERAAVDTIAVVRGGGARGDLVVFDSERVARAIATCRVPVLTGIGHEIDDSIADRVAHQALKTPTACAASLVERVDGYLRRIDDAAARVGHLALRRLDRDEHALDEHGRRTVRRARQVLQHADERLAGHASSLAGSATRSLRRGDERLEAHSERLIERPARTLRDHERRLDSLAAQVRAHDPVRVMARGWSITRRGDGTVVRSIGDVAAGDALVTTIADGAIHSSVDRTEPIEAPGEH